MSLAIPVPPHDMSPPSSVEALSPRSFIEPDSSPSDDDDNDDRQSCENSSTRSVRSVNQSIFDFINIDGRTYHRYQAGLYLFPNDKPENDRLELQYHILNVVFRGRLHFAPLKNPKRILDIGTGTGQWAIDMAKVYPNAAITGTDLSPIQPQWHEENVKFVIDDANEDDWMLHHPMDYIHTRIMMGCFNDFREIIARGFRNLKPGGWMESQEPYPTVYCDDGTMPPDYAFAEWTQIQDKAFMDLGKPLRIANKLKRWYEQAGFVDVHEEVYKLPINAWPRDPQWKMVGAYNARNIQEGLQAQSLRPFQEGLNWTKDEIEVYLAHVRKEINDRNVHAYHKIYVVWGRRPLEDELGVPSPPSVDPAASASGTS